MTGPSHFGATASQGEFQADWDPGLQDNARKIQHKASRHNQGACTEIRRRETGRLRAIASLRGLPVVAGLSSVVAIKCFDGGAAGASVPVCLALDLKSRRALALFAGPPPPDPRAARSAGRVGFRAERPAAFALRRSEGFRSALA